MKSFDELTKNKLKQHVESILVPHTAFSSALETLEQCYRAAPIIRDPIGCFIGGESRSGKSRLIEEFRIQHPEYRTEEGMVIPVVYVEVPSKPTVKGLVSEILAAFGDPLADKGTEQERTRRLLKFIKQCKTEVLILDEFQHFVDKSSKFTVIHHVSDWLKTLLNKAKIVTVIAGLPYGKAVLSQNEQLRGRFTKSINLPRFNWKDDDLRAEFLGLLDGFTNVLREHFTLPDLGDENMAFRFYLATGGLTGYVFNIIRQAVWNVVDDNRTTINLEDLDMAYPESVHELDRHPTSPFNRKFNLTDSLAFEAATRIGLRAEDYVLKPSAK